MVITCKSCCGRTLRDPYRVKKSFCRNRKRGFPAHKHTQTLYRIGEKMTGDPYYTTTQQQLWRASCSGCSQDVRRVHKTPRNNVKKIYTKLKNKCGRPSEYKWCSERGNGYKVITIGWTYLIVMCAGKWRHSTTIFWILCAYNMHLYMKRRDVRELHTKKEKKKGHLLVLYLISAPRRRIISGSALDRNNVYRIKNLR